MNPTDNNENAENWIAGAMRAHQAPLLRYVSRLLGGDRDRAQDIVQDAFLRLWQQSADAVDGHVVEWLYRVSRNRAIDVIRKEGRMRAFGEGEMEQLTTTDSRPSKALEKAETQQAVLELLDRLPANQQEVVRLKFQNGFSYKEISRITELSVSNVGYLIHMAVRQLRAEMAAQQL
ncbi:MAG: RNA polymerase sigma factor [bacterium]